MGGLLTALNAGKTSLITNQKSIEIVGNNIANVNTEGYSRQRAELTQIPAVNFNDFFVGQGVTVSNVRRDYDVFISRQLQEKSIAFGEESGRSTPLTEMERIFNISDENLASEMDRFFDAWQQLTTNPSGPVERDMVIQRGQLLGNAFRNTYDELDTVSKNINNSIISKIDAINEKISEIAKLNDRIHLVETSGQSANAALDQRDLLVEDLSRTLGVQTYTDNRGMLAVQLPGGTPLVQGNQAMSLEIVTTGTDVNLQVRIGDSTKTVHLQDMGGEFKGMFEMRDVFIADLRTDLDNLAVEFTSAVNDAHDNGYGLNDNIQRQFFDDLAGPPPIANAARHVNVFAEIADNSNNLAAATEFPAAPGDNRNALEIAALETTYFINGTDTFDNFFGTMVATVGIEAGRNKLALGGAKDATIQLQNLRDGFAGVSLEEEMIDLIQYQRGFESSAKFLSTIDEMMNSLIAMKR
ncbi:MAG: flagellar hook-associated protein FlgK [Desulfobulbaceae bacterium]|nr:flagellar hook-associated protein FlgK [Desulfobulbaceae bacterium]